MSGDKPKVAFYWCASCGGCEEAIVDLNERLLDVAAAVDIVFWPVALDFKRHDVEALPDGALAAAFVNGAIRTSENEEMARLLRRKARLVFAFGACAQLGGVPGLANLSTREELLSAVYSESPSTPDEGGTRPVTRWSEDGREVELPSLSDSVRPLSHVVEVDYSVPGCPPTPAMLAGAVEALLSGTLPARGAVLAPDVALCESCPRRESKPEKLSLPAFTRPHLVLIDQEKCLLAQGLLCMGVATRGGCEARCITGNMPCTGCFGPTSRVRDFGGKALSAMASMLEAKDGPDVAAAVATIPDPVGTFYRYGLPAAAIARRRS